MERSQQSAIEVPPGLERKFDDYVKNTPLKVSTTIEKSSLQYIAQRHIAQDEAVLVYAVCHSLLQELCSSEPSFAFPAMNLLDSPYLFARSSPYLTCVSFSYAERFCAHCHVQVGISAFQSRYHNDFYEFQVDLLESHHSMDYHPSSVFRVAEI